MATKADLVRRTLKLLGAFAAGQDPSAEDVEAVEGYIPGKLEELSQREIIDVPNVEEIDPALVQWLAMLVAQDAAPEFGVAMDATAIQVAESRLRAMNAARPAYTPMQGVYY